MFKKSSRFKDPLAILSLILIIFFSAYALEKTYWTYNLNRVTTLAVLGVVTGLLIGASNFSKTLSNVLIYLYGISIFILQFIIPLSVEPEWNIRMRQFLERISRAISQLSRNIPLEDGILFLTVAGMIFLTLSMISGLRLVRSQQIWLPLSIIIAMYLLIQIYLPEPQRNYLFISLYSIMVIYFVGRHYFLQKQNIWQENGIKTGQEISVFFNRYLALIAIGLVVVSWGIPTFLRLIKISEFSEEPQLRQRNSKSWELAKNFFYPLRQQTGFGEGYFPEILALGYSRSLKDNEVLVVSVDNNHALPVRYYWKGRIYDSYENGLWKNKNSELGDSSSFDFDSQYPKTLSNNEFLFNYLYPRDVIFSPQYIKGLNREVNLQVYSDDQQTKDLISLIDYQWVKTGESVNILGGFNTFPLEDLKEEKGEYPSWILERYLTLPENLPKKVYELGRDLVRGKRSNIERALSVIEYLRTSYRYKDFVDIPQGQDPVEWFLFSGREGFCNYFASSAILLLRSVGIPSRMVVGYAQGERINGLNDYLVRIKDSHSWVEVYIAGFGWITLEATPSQPSVEFPSELKKTDNYERVESLYLQPPEQIENLKDFREIYKKYTPEADSYSDYQDKQSRLGYILLILSAIFAILAIGIILVFFRQKANRLPIIIERTLNQKNWLPRWIKRWANFERLEPLEKNYFRLQILSRLILNKKNETPQEFLKRLFSVIDHPESLEFTKTLQISLYGRKNETLVNLDIKTYRKILASIVRKWFDKKIKYLQYRLNFTRFNK